MSRKSERKLISLLLESLKELKELLTLNKSAIEDKYDYLMTETDLKLNYISEFLSQEEPDYSSFRYRVMCPKCNKFLLNLSSTHLKKHNLTEKDAPNINNECSKFIISAKKYIQHGVKPRVGFKASEETCSKISKALKGKNTWTKGKSWSPERKELIKGSLNGMNKIWNVMTDKEKEAWRLKGKENGLKSIGSVSLEGFEKQKNATIEYWKSQENRDLQSKKLSGENNGMFGRSMNRRSFRGIYESKKGGEIRFKSRDEKYFAMFLDKSDEVLYFQYETLKIPYIIERNEEKVKRNAYPDFLVALSNGEKIIFEIKGEHLFKRENTNNKLDVISEYCSNNELGFTIITIDILFDLIKDKNILEHKDYLRFKRRSKRFLEKASKNENKIN